MNRWVLRRILEQLREGAEVISCGRLLYADGPKLEKALAPYIFVACLRMMGEDLAEECSVLVGLYGTRRGDMYA